MGFEHAVEAVESFRVSGLQKQIKKGPVNTIEEAILHFIHALNWQGY